MGRPARAGIALIAARTSLLAIAVLAATPVDAARRARATVSADAIAISEVMVNPTGPEYAREFVELANTSSAAVDLAGWAIGDTVETDPIVAAGGGTTLRAGGYAVVVDPTYLVELDVLRYDIPADALVLTIGDASFGSGGLVNSRAGNIVLRAPNGTEQRFGWTVAEVKVEGYSLEAIDLALPADAANRALSRTIEGTPGRPNSRRLAAIDLAVTAVSVVPDSIHPPADAVVRADVANAGSATVAGAELVVYADMDGDTALSPADPVLARVDIPAIARGETFRAEVGWRVDAPPAGPLALAIRAAGDERPENDARRVPVAVGVPAGSMRITEVMAQPDAGEGQWIELANAGSTPIPLAGCAVATSRGTALLATPASIVAPGDYLVVAAAPDSVRRRYGSEVPVACVAGTFPYMSRSTDADRSVRLVDATGANAERARYPVPELGRSLELVAFALSGDDESAWRTALGTIRATPGLPNQSMVPPAEDASVAIGPDVPCDTAGIALDLPEPEVFLTIRVYDRLGREIRRVVDGERWPAHSAHRWDGLDTGGRPAPTGVYVVLVEATGVPSGRSWRFARPVVIARTR